MEQPDLLALLAAIVAMRSYLVLRWFTLQTYETGDFKTYAKYTAFTIFLAFSSWFWLIVFGAFEVGR